ncbi:MAG: hypothetical protein HC905_10610 [Bacteroidales bacterium]|nr:hypothetical protein [Bacteroidales bacterium]
MVPPHAAKVSKEVSKEVRAANDRRLALEDSIRNCYMETFKDSAWAVSLAVKLGLSPDTLRPMIFKSYGNWKEISTFIENNTSKHRRYILPFLTQISDKDFSDTRETILSDQLNSAMDIPRNPEIPEDIFVKYILSPRMSIEFLTPWRSFLRQSLGEKLAAESRKDISALTSWIRTNINIDNTANLHSRAPLSPAGVYNLGAANASSRDIFFVAACRAFGIPARLNPETQVPEYFEKGKWMLAGFDAAPPIQPVKGTLQLTQKDNPVEPQYYYHFTIGRIQDGICRTLEFEEGRKLSDFPASVSLDTGRYVLVTGNRLEDGSVLSSMTFFNITANNPAQVAVSLRKLPGNLKPSGKTDFTNLGLLRNGQTDNYTSLIGDKDAVVMLIDPDKEPSKHILNDLGPYVDHFNKWDGVFVVAFPQEKSQQAGVLKTYTLPENLVAGVDSNDGLLHALSDIYGPDLKDRLPLVVVCDNKGNIYLFSAGYKIGIGEQILKITPVLKAIKASCEKP